jgi:hypothetical protein
LGVLELRHRLGFDAEPGQIASAGVIAGQDHFQRHETLQSALPSLVNHAHRSPAQDAEDFIARDLRRLALFLSLALRDLLLGAVVVAVADVVHRDAVCGKNQGFRLVRCALAVLLWQLHRRVEVDGVKRFVARGGGQFLRLVGIFNRRGRRFARRGLAGP